MTIYDKIKYVYKFLEDLGATSLAVVPCATALDGSMYLGKDENGGSLCLYSRDCGIIKDINMKTYIYSFILYLIDIRSDITNFGVINFIECNDDFICFNFRCKTILDYIANSDKRSCFKFILYKDGTNKIFPLRSLNE